MEYFKGKWKQRYVIYFGPKGIFRIDRKKQQCEGLQSDGDYYQGQNIIHIK